MKPQPSLFDEPSCPPSFPSQRVERPAGWVSLSTLAPAGPEPKSRGIARAAQRAEEIDQRNDVEYRDLPCKSLLSACDSPRVPFDYTINPYRGCEFGCVYCFARYTHEYMELKTFEEFERKIFVKGNAREALLNDLRKKDLRGKWIAIGTATDPYQPAERRYRLTRSLLEVMASRRNLHLSITTKSDLVARDLDLLQRIREHSDLHVNVTITTPHHDLSRRTEPRAPRPDKRFAAVRALSGAGIRVGILLMPVLPRITDRLEDLDLLIRTAKEAGASYLATQILYLRSCSRPTFFAFIQERFPELLPYYERLYSRKGAEALALYSRQKTAEIQAIKQRHGLIGWRRGSQTPAFAPDQLDLFDPSAQADNGELLLPLSMDAG